MQHKPKSVAFFATNDEHDRPGRNRRDAIYRRVAARVLQHHYKQDAPKTNQMAAKRSFTRVARRRK